MMDLAVILYSLMAVTLWLAFMVAIAWKEIYYSLQRFIVKRYRSRGIAHFFGADFRVRTKLIDINGKEFVDNKGTYLIDKSKIVYHKGVPCIYYSEGNSKPIDIRGGNLEIERKVTTENGEERIITKEVDAKYLNTLIMRAKSIGMMQAFMDISQLKMFLIIAVGASCIGAGLVFQMQSDITDMGRQIATLTKMVSALQPVG